MVKVTKEKNCQKSDGEVSPNVILDDVGKPMSLVAIIEDVSKRKVAEAELKKNRLDLERAQKIAHIGNWEWDARTGKVVWSKEIFRIFGLKRQEPSYELVKSLTHPDDTEYWERSVQSALEKGKHLRFDFRVIKSDGAVRWIHYEAEIIRDKNGQPLKFFGIAQDITERKSAEEKLRRHTEDLDLIHSLNLAVNQGKDVREVINILAHKLFKIFHNIGCTVYLLGGDREHLIAHRLSLSSKQVRVIERLIGMKMPEIQVKLRHNRILRKLLENGEPTIINNVKEIVEYAKEHTENKVLKRAVPHVIKVLGIGSVMVVPLISQQKPIGLLTISRKERFSNIELERCRSILSLHLAEVIAHVQAEMTVKEREKKYRGLFDDALDMIHIVDEDGYIVDANRIELKKLEYTRDELIGKRLLDIVHPDYREHTVEKLREVMSGEKIMEYETTIVTKSGKKIIVEVNAVPEKVNGKVVSARAILRDVGERKKAEEALRKSEENYRLVSENIPVAVYSALPDENSTSLFISGRIKELTGYMGKQFLDDPALFGEIVHVEDRDDVWRSIEEHRKRKGPLDIEYRIKAKDGTVKWIRDKANPVLGENGEVIRIDGFMEDISKRKLTKIALRESEVSKRSILATAPIGIGLVRERKIIWASDKFYVMLGYTKGELEGKNARVVYASDEEYERVGRQKYANIRKSGTGEIETRWRRKDGRVIDVLLRSSAINRSDLSKGVTFTALDITDRKRMEGALRESEEKYKGIIDNIQIGISVINPKMEIISINSQMKEWFPSIDVSKKPTCYVAYNDPPKRKICPYCPTIETLKDGLVHESVSQTSSSKEIKNYRVVSSPIRDSKGNVIAAVEMVEDITEKLRMETELLKQEKLESLGVLAGGIAHDFNNILLSLIGNISLAKNESQEGSELRELICEAERAAERAKSLTHQLLTFSKGGAPVMETKTIDGVIRETAEFVLHGTRARCGFSIADDLHAVDVDEDQISQVINNMVINAVQSMPSGGLIHIEAQNVSLDAEGDLPPGSGEYIRIAIKDHGIGIPDEHLKKIFDPFFTTKESGNGLGLSSCYSIINRHGGHIHVESEVGRGSTFSIYLPTSKRKQKKTRGTEDLIETGGGKILVVDDEEPIRKLTNKMLKKLGYKADVVSNGFQAIKHYQKAMRISRPYDAVILDLTVPGGLGGREIVEQLYQIDPGVKAIVSSGHSNDPILADYKTSGFCQRLVKPYKVEDLSRVLKQILK